MKQIIILIIRFAALRHEAHYEFLTLFQTLLNTFPAVKALVIAFVPEFDALLEREEAILKPKRKSRFTALLEASDKRIDRTVVSINSYIDAALHHFDPAKVAAAKLLYDRLRDFGKIGSKAYEEESAAVQVLLRDLNDNYKDAVATVGIGDLVNELNIAEQEFTQLFMARNAELADRPDDKFQDIRRNIEPVYRKMTTVITTDVLLNGLATSGELVRQLNREIMYYNEHARRVIKKSIEHCTAETIAVQPYTEEAVTPIPKVYFTEEGKPTKKLVFTVDYTVTYRDNVNPGTAEIILHGKGAYKDRKIISFNIAR
jgi:hypothetical protein